MSNIIFSPPKLIPAQARSLFPINDGDATIADIRLDGQSMEGLTSTDGTVENSFSVAAQGTGSISGIAYTVSAMTSAEITGKLSVPSLTSENVDNLNSLIGSMLDASAKEEINEYAKSHGSVKLSAWSFWASGASAGSKTTKDSMKSSGLSEDQITKIINEAFEFASSMSTCGFRFNVNNTSRYPVSGSLLLYTIGGEVKTSDGQSSTLRMVADQGSYGDASNSAPANGDIFEL